ncbi:metallophosphoesterase [Aliiroseovarius sp. YM-037]|uniref:phosphodiesterase n=1 Tax=Aliiroseovarius sp. YM-037 TaxID=3341728 RepID=UPI003A7FFAA8
MLTNASKILVFTDVHITKAGQQIIGLDPLERFQTGLRHALGHHPDAERLIVMGDLVHFGSRKEYERLAGALRDVPIPVHLMVGNHDRREAFLEVFPDTPVTGSGHVQTVIDVAGTRLILLDTLDGPPYPDGHHAGRLCPDRLAWFDTAIAEAGGRKLMVFMHHPPFSVGFDGMDSIRLDDSDAFIARLRNMPNVTHIFAGHVHRTISGQIGGIPFSILKSPCHQMPMLLGAAGTAHSIVEPGAYGIVLITPDSTIVHTEDFDLPARDIQSYET